MAHLRNNDPPILFKDELWHMEHQSALYSLSFAFEYRKMPHYKERFKVLILQVSQCPKSGQLTPLFTQTSLQKSLSKNYFLIGPG